MDLIIFPKLILVLLLVLQVPTADARKKSLKIIIPNKVKYVHHHHTHVLIMKDKKPHLQPNAKYHHLHIYDGAKKKNKNVNHHFYIPYIQQPVDDEEDEESVRSYTVVRPNGRGYRNDDRYHITRRLPPVYEEPIYTSYSGRYRIYDRSSQERFSAPEVSNSEYYEADPFFAEKGKVLKDYIPDKGRYSNRVKSPDIEYEYKRKYLPLHSEYDDGRVSDSASEYYPEDRFYAKTRGREMFN